MRHVLRGVFTAAFWLRHTVIYRWLEGVIHLRRQIGKYACCPNVFPSRNSCSWVYQGCLWQSWAVPQASVQMSLGNGRRKSYVYLETRKRNTGCQVSRWFEICIHICNQCKTRRIMFDSSPTKTQEPKPVPAIHFRRTAAQHYW